MNDLPALFFAPRFRIPLFQSSVKCLYLTVGHRTLASEIAPTCRQYRVLVEDLEGLFRNHFAEQWQFCASLRFFLLLRCECT